MTGAPSAPDPIAMIDPQDLPENVDKKYVEKYKPTREMFTNPLEDTNYAASLSPEQRVKVQKDYDQKIAGVFKNLGGKMNPSGDTAFNQATNLYNEKYMKDAAQNKLNRETQVLQSSEKVLWNNLIMQARRGNSSAALRPNMGPYKSFGAQRSPSMGNVVASAIDRKQLVGS